MTGISSQFRLLQGSMEFAKQNHRVISQNVANVNTPGYKAQQLSFDQLLQALHGESDAGELQVELTPGLETRVDGNNVDLDHEVASLKKNSMMFQAMTQILASKMDMIERAMSK